MDNIQLIFYACRNILNISFELYGYSITLQQVLIFGFVVSVLGSFIFKALS